MPNNPVSDILQDCPSALLQQFVADCAAVNSQFEAELIRFISQRIGDQSDLHDRLRCAAARNTWRQLKDILFAVQCGEINLQTHHDQLIERIEEFSHTCSRLNLPREVRRQLIGEILNYLETDELDGALVDAGLQICVDQSDVAFFAELLGSAEYDWFQDLIDDRLHALENPHHTASMTPLRDLIAHFDECPSDAGLQAILNAIPRSDHSELLRQLRPSIDRALPVERAFIMHRIGDTTQAFTSLRDVDLMAPANPDSRPRLIRLCRLLGQVDPQATIDAVKSALSPFNQTANPELAAHKAELVDALREIYLEVLGNEAEWQAFNLRLQDAISRDALFKEALQRRLALC